MVGVCPGCGAAWLAHLSGGQGVGGSNPLSPTLTVWIMFVVVQQKLTSKVRKFMSTKKFIDWPIYQRT